MEEANREKAEGVVSDADLENARKCGRSAASKLIGCVGTLLVTAFFCVIAYALYAGYCNLVAHGFSKADAALDVAVAGFMFLYICNMAWSNVILQRKVEAVEAERNDLMDRTCAIAKMAAEQDTLIREMLVTFKNCNEIFAAGKAEGEKPEAESSAAATEPENKNEQKGE